MLPRAGFRDDAALAHSHREQSLAKTIVNFMRAGVQQVFALDVNPRAAQMFREPRSKLQRCGAPGKILQQRIEFALKFWVLARHFVGTLEFFERSNERFGDVTPSVRTEASFLVRPCLCGGRHWCLFKSLKGLPIGSVVPFVARLFRGCDIVPAAA